jgi:hypothetical protein
MAQNIDFTTEILDFDGKTIIEKKMKVERFITCPQCGNAIDLSEHGEFDERELTLREMAITALRSPQQKLKSSELYDRYGLVMRIAQRDSVQLTSGEITLIKEAVGEMYEPVRMGRAWDILDPPPVEEES